MTLSQDKVSGHRERLRQRFLSNGIEGFLDYEILELLLTLSTPRKDCKKIAKDILEKFVNIQNVFEADPDELIKIKGLGNNNIMPVLIIKAVAETYLKKKILKKNIVSCSKDVFDYLFYSMRDKDLEIFKTIVLDNKNKIIDTKDIHTGSISSSAVYPREIIKYALSQKATSIIFVHNHPSGDITPSSSDIRITRKLVHACMYVDIKVHEHIIIGDNIYFSFADEGYIKKFVSEFISMEKEGLDV